MNIHNGLPPKNNTESLSYIGGYFNNYITDILHYFCIYVSYLLDNCALIRNKVCTKSEIGVCIIFDFFVCGGHPVCTIIIFVYVLRIIIYKKSIKNQYC